LQTKGISRSTSDRYRTSQRLGHFRDGTVGPGSPSPPVNALGAPAPAQALPSPLVRLETQARQKALRMADVRHTLPDMKLLTVRDLNRKTASVLDAIERGETFELRRNGRAVGYISPTPPAPQRKPDWKAHFAWLRQNATKHDLETITEFDEERRRQAAREQEMGNLK
jgi:antitoxin (DNA-binding transcriptional repressor) of toxin-antitoxin stability system